MPAATVIRHLAAASCTLTLLPDGRVRISGPGNPPQPPPPHLLALARQHRDEITKLLADKTDGPEGTQASPEEHTPPRLTRPSALPGDPAAPIVDEAATLVLTKLELVGAGPHLALDGTLALAHPERADTELLASSQLQQADIIALLSYRVLLEQLWPVSAEPPSPP